MKKIRRILSALLALMMTLTVLPVSGLAEPQSSGGRKEILVYVTIANQGNFQRGADGTLMAEVPVVVQDTDGDGKVSVQETLEQVHRKYCPNGFAVTSAKCGPVISRLWNQKVVNTGFYINNQRGFALRDELNFYDSLYVFSEKSASDTFTYFAKSDDQAVCLREYHVQLLSEAYAEDGKVLAIPVENAELYQVRNDGSLKDLHVKTDKEGKAGLIFREPGDFVLTAKAPQKNSVSPVLKVKVARGMLSLVLGE